MCWRKRPSTKAESFIRGATLRTRGRAGRSAEDRLLCKQEALGSNPSRSILRTYGLIIKWCPDSLSARGSDAGARKGSSRPGEGTHRPPHRITSRRRHRAAPACCHIRSPAQHSTHRGPVRGQPVQPRNIELCRDRLRFPRQHRQIGWRHFRSIVRRWSSPGCGGLLRSRRDGD